MTGSFETRFSTSPEEGVKAPCVASTTANITLSGEQTIDSVAVLAGNRVLVRSQTDSTENGIYDASTGPWVRSTDFNNSNDVVNGILAIDSNQSNNGVYQALFSGDYEPGVTSVTFSEILFNTLTSKIGSTGFQGEYNDKGQYHINYMDDLIGVDLTSFVVGETVLCNALNVSSAGTYSIWEKVADAQTPPDPATGLNTTDNRWYSALTNATEFKQVRQLSVLTINDLKLVEGTPNQIIEVVSYDAPNFTLANPYSGNGKFAWDSTSLETDDSATTRTVIQATGVTTGRWIRVYDALVDAAGNFTGTDVETALSECATKTTTQALTNKTLTTPIIDTPAIDAPEITGIITGSSFLDENDMVSDSASKLASQQSIKAYVDAKLVTLDTPVALVSISSTTGSWVPVDMSAVYSTASDAGATKAIVRITSTSKDLITSTLTETDSYIRKRGTSLTNDVLTKVTSASEQTNSGDTLNAKSTNEVLVNLDSNSDFEWYHEVNGSSGTYSATLVGYYV